MASVVTGQQLSVHTHKQVLSSSDTIEPYSDASVNKVAKYGVYRTPFWLNLSRVNFNLNSAGKGGYIYRGG